MKPDFFATLPSEIITNILSRLSVRTIAISKCVCKQWLYLLGTRDFVNLHLSKSAPALAVLVPEEDTNWCKIFKLEDIFDLQSNDPITEFDFPHGSTIEGSTNGLLLLHMLNDCDADFLYVSNPITRELFELHSLPQGVAFGFGASKITGQHKVVSIGHKSPVNPKAKPSCHVYTLGSGSWRRVEANPFDYGRRSFGEFANGNLHWLVSSQSDDSKCVSCFDVEKECFSTFPASAPLQRISNPWGLSTFRDCLCFCDDSSQYEIVIWLIKDYEIDKSWSKEYVIQLDTSPGADIFGFVWPIKIVENGDILMLCDSKIFIYYSNETKSYEEIGLFGTRDYYLDSMLLTPSFLSLKSLGMEDVFSY